MQPMVCSHLPAICKWRTLYLSFVASGITGAVITLCLILMVCIKMDFAKYLNNIDKLRIMCRQTRREEINFCAEILIKQTL